MALRAKKPADIARDKRLKLLMFGNAGVGKTTAATQFPKPYLIDTERGAENDEYIDALEATGGAILQTSEFDEIIAEVLALTSEPHDYQTLVIDPITTVYHTVLDRAREKNKDSKQMFSPEYTEAKNRMRHLLSLLLRPDLDMNVVVTAHAKADYSGGADTGRFVQDTSKGFEYPFDLVLELQLRGKKRVAVPTKSRIKGFTKDKAFDFSYDAVAEIYGRDILERAAKTVDLASPDQIERLSKLIRDANESEDRVAKFLSKYSAENFGELPAEAAQRAIDHYAEIVDGMKKGAA